MAKTFRVHPDNNYSSAQAQIITLEGYRKPMKLKERLREVVRRNHHADSTFEAYWSHVESFLRFHRVVAGKWIPPEEMGSVEVTRFLTHLAVDKHVSATTQNQALAAILYVYKNVLKIELTGVEAMRAKQGKYLPTVLNREELAALFSRLDSTSRLACELMYASGMRVSEVVCLRLKDLDFDRCWSKRVIEVSKALVNQGMMDRKGGVKAYEVLLVNKSPGLF